MRRKPGIFSNALLFDLAMITLFLLLIALIKWMMGPA